MCAFFHFRLRALVPVSDLYLISFMRMLLSIENKVENLLEQLDAKFDDMSSQILDRSA